MTTSISEQETSHMLLSSALKDVHGANVHIKLCPTLLTSAEH